MSESTGSTPYGAIVLEPGGARIIGPGMPEILIPWDELLEVSVSAYDAGQDVERVLSFDHASGHVVEVWHRADGWERAISDLGTYMSLVVDDPVAVCRTITPDDEPASLARAR